jgi:hypothetical protein
MSFYLSFGHVLQHLRNNDKLSLSNMNITISKMND